MQGAKFLFHAESQVSDMGRDFSYDHVSSHLQIHTQVSPHRGDTAYQDIEVVQELRAMIRGMKHDVKVQNTRVFSMYLVLYSIPSPSYPTPHGLCPGGTLGY